MWGQTKMLKHQQGHRHQKRTVRIERFLIVEGCQPRRSTQDIGNTENRLLVTISLSNFDGFKQFAVKFADFFRGLAG